MLKERHIFPAKMYDNILPIQDKVSYDLFL